jgi:putative nucleotide binding protein
MSDDAADKPAEGEPAAADATSAESPDEKAEEAGGAAGTDGAAVRLQGVVLDHLPNGRSGDGGPGYNRDALALVLGDDCRLYECTVEANADLTIGGWVDLDPTSDSLGRVHEIEFEDLTAAAESELEYAVAELLDAEPDRFVAVYNDAEPITLRLHQLNLLPGIGKKLRNAILDERERRPFQDFDDVAERVAGLHDPRETLEERVLEELRSDDLKYRIFVGRFDE